VRLPKAAAAARVMSQDLAAVSVATPPARRGRILVVDDERFVGKAVVRTLSRDHNVELCTRAADALAKLEKGARYDIILCDLMMPEMTGMELYDEIARRIPEQVERMVFMTGGAFTPGARSFLEAVPNQRIEKPFDMQNLSALLADRIK
jgi:CheY-like chemotaxis protein